jgi:hypothetical protein
MKGLKQMLTKPFIGFKKNVNRATTQVMMKTGTECIDSKIRLWNAAYTS